LEKERTNSFYKENKNVLHGIISLTFYMLQDRYFEVTVAKNEKQKKVHFCELLKELLTNEVFIQF